MARYHPTKDAEPVLTAARTWIESCLINEGSLFGNESLWSLTNLQAIAEAFTDNPDSSDRGFYEKLEGQMAPAAPQVKRLMAEMLWALMLIQANIGPERKRGGIGKVWGWSGTPLDMNHRLLSDATLTGLANPGTAFNTMRWRELNYLIALALDLRQRPVSERKQILNNRADFEAWIEAAPMNGKRQFKHIFRYLAFPEFNERIMQSDHRGQILRAFDRLDPASIDAMTDHALDDALLALRKDLATNLGTSDLDFYDDRLEDRWRKPNRPTIRPASPSSTAFSDLKARFLRAYPEFSSFKSDPRYQADERAYKDELVRLFEQTVEPLLAEADWTAAGQAATDLLSRPLAANENKPQNLVHYIPASRLRKLDQESKKAFGLALNALLDEESDLETRVDTFVARLVELVPGDPPLQPSAQRAITGLFLTLANPKAHLFLKTTQLREALVMLDPGFSWEPARLTGRDVVRVEEVAADVMERLKAERWSPRDMIDVQGFLWVAAAYGNEISGTRSPTPPSYDPAAGNSHTSHVGSEPSNSIFFGPPGTGKTWRTVPAALALIDPDHPSLSAGSGDRAAMKQCFDAHVKSGRIRFVTFHQSFSYEDFIEGLRADTDESGALRYNVAPGVFKSFCDEARAAPNDASGRRPNYVLIIDEINRGNLSRIFGELITLIEPDKREGMPEQLSAVLPYSKERFSVPANLHIIATMNTADRSLAGMDTAVRRRFEFTEIEPNPEVLDGIEVDGLDVAELLRCINQRIELLLDREHRIGHSYFLSLKADPSIRALKQIFARKILPLLTEYFFDDWERISWVLNDHRPHSSVPRFIVRKEQSLAKQFGSEITATMEVKNWRLNAVALDRIECYQGIVEQAI